MELLPASAWHVFSLIVMDSQNASDLHLGVVSSLNDLASPVGCLPRGLESRRSHTSDCRPLTAVPPCDSSCPEQMGAEGQPHSTLPHPAHQG